MAAGRAGADQILAVDPARRYRVRPPGRPGQAALADRARLPGPEARTWIGPLRRTRMARVPPSRQSVHCGLRVPDLREGEDSPLSTSCPLELPETCRSPRLPTPRRRRSGPNGTSPTRSRPCDDASRPPSPGASTAAHAAMRSASQRTLVAACDAVRLAGLPCLGRGHYPALQAADLGGQLGARGALQKSV